METLTWLINENIKKEYDRLVSISSTYDDLEKNIEKYTRDIIFEDCGVGKIVRDKMLGFLRKDAGNLSVR